MGMKNVSKNLNDLDASPAENYRPTKQNMGSKNRKATKCRLREKNNKNTKTLLKKKNLILMFVYEQWVKVCFRHPKVFKLTDFLHLKP